MAKSDSKLPSSVKEGITSAISNVLTTDVGNEIRKTLGTSPATKNSEEARLARVNDTTKTFQEQLKSLLELPSTDNSSLYPFVSYEDFDHNGNVRGTVSSDPEADVALPGGRLVRYAESVGDEAGIANDSPTFLMDALVYIQGVEVSEFIRGGIRVSLNGTQSFNEVSFTLDNDNDRFVWTEQNLVSYHGKSAAKANAPYLHQMLKSIGSNLSPEQAFKDPEVVSKLNGIAFNSTEKVKEAFFRYKTGIKPDGKPRNPPIRNPKNTLMFARFDIAPNRAVINRMDPIRVFSLYPFRVPGVQWEDGERQELWVPEFTGYVQNVSVDDDEIRNVSRITVSCTCVRQAVLRRMRISSDYTSGLTSPLDSLGFALSPAAQRGVDSPQTAQAQAAQQQISDNTEGFYDINETQFYDDIINTNFGQLFPNKRLEEAVRDLLVESPDISVTKNRRGVRGISFGGNFFYDSKGFDRGQAQAFMEEWHKFCLFGPKRRPWTFSEVETVGQETTTDGKYAPNKVRLWFLLPASGSGPSNLADLSQVSVNLAHDVNWTNRQEVLTNIVDSVDYNLMVSPCGDLICEFTQADFRPEDYGEFRQSFRLEKGLVASQFASEQDNPPAGLVVTTGFAVGAASPSEIASTQLTKVFVYSPYIAARYGIEIAQESIPYLQAHQKDIAAQRAVMLYQRMLARSHAWSMQISYRPFILPNRPLHHIKRSRIGLTVSVEKTIELGKAPKGEIQCGMEHPRLFTGHYRSLSDLQNLNDLQRADLQSKRVDPDDLELLAGIDPTSSLDSVELQVFSTVAAGESTPISNRVGWSADSILAPASGIYVLNLAKMRNASYDIQVATAADEPEAADVGSVIETDGQEDTQTYYMFKSDPLERMHLTSPFNKIRTINGVKEKSPHSGADLRALPGKVPLLAVEDGRVWGMPRQNRVPGSVHDPRSGNTIVLKTDSGFYVWYMHCDPSTLEFINKNTGKPFQHGDVVKAGDQIGLSGSSGSARGAPHLHIEVVPTSVARKNNLVRDDGRPVQQKKNGTKVDPWPYFPASGGKPHPSSVKTSGAKKA